MANDTKDLKTTPLTALHRELGATMVDFAGYSMPVQYPSGVVAEHHHVREKAGLFDVSHMGPALLMAAELGGGDEAHARICSIFEPLVCGDLASLSPGELRYTLLLDENGGILDDLIVSRPGSAGFQGALYIVVNAGCKEADFARIEAACTGAKLVRSDMNGLLALQGPAARKVLIELAPKLKDLVFMTSASVEILGASCIVTCSGYTGEDGFEILVPAADAERLARRLLEHPDVAPIGLGARDSLRLEAGLCLYGHDMDQLKTPVEASLTWAVSKSRRARADFPGAARILAQIENGADVKRVGLKLLDKAPAREGAAIALKNGDEIGVVTSGGPGLTYGAPIAMGYVPRPFSAIGTEVDIIVRNKPRAAVVTRMPFVKQSYFRG